MRSTVETQHPCETADDIAANIWIRKQSPISVAGHIISGPLPAHIIMSRNRLERLSFPTPAITKTTATTPANSKATPDKNDAHQGSTTNLHMRVFMPADSPSMKLCKEVMSAMALGYPAPTILNWRGEFNRPEWHLAGSHIAKLESLLEAIDELLSDPGQAVENDVALLVDAYDVWFQLPPSVLLKRFHQMNEDANKRIAKEWEGLQKNGRGDDFPIPPPQQNIIVTTAKDCFPLSDSGSDPHYEHWPESPMPDDMYGEGTDSIIPQVFEASRKYKKIRPRCANSGMIMGTMGALRAALKRAQIKVEAVSRNGRQLWSDQSLFGEVIGDQEMWREWVGHMAAGWNGTTSEVDMTKLEKDVRLIAAASMQQQTGFEFGIGLDYGFATIPPTCSAEDDGYFVKINDKQALEIESLKAGVPGGVRVHGIPPELRGGLPEHDILHGIAWGDVPLYTDFFFGTTPVGIHHNAFVDGLKESRIQDWWELMWFYPNLREILTKQLQPLPWSGKPNPLATVVVEGGRSFTYFAPLKDLMEKTAKVFEPATKKKQQATFRSLAWDDVCQVKGQRPWFRELLGDGKGRLII